MRIKRREVGRGRGGERQGQKRPSTRAGKDEVAKSASEKIRNPYAFARLEERIFSLEAKLLTIRESLADQAIWHEPESMKELGKQQEALATELNELMEQWENW